MGHIWLVGMMGSGKTTVGAIVAERLNRPLADTDTLVMQAEGRTIPELFAESEEAFRSAERRVVASFAGMPDSVVATGGGVVLDERNTTVMSELGTVVLLRASVDDLVERLGVDDDSRPLYRGRHHLDRLAAERDDLYAAAADSVIDTGGRSAHEVAEEVLACVNT